MKKGQLTQLGAAQELEYQKLLQEATEELYDNIFESNFTDGLVGSRHTVEYFESLGITGDTPYGEVLKKIAEKQIIEKAKRNKMAFSIQSQRDSLSRLYNKAATETRIAEILAVSDTSRNKHALFVLDIDNFKTVNDSLGHSAGDCIISEFAEELQVQFHGSDIVGRIGSDEFIILMNNYGDLYMLTRKLERFCAKLRLKNFGKHQHCSISCSIGVALYPDHGTSYTELYENADQALYYAKGHGKASFHILREQNNEDSAISFHAKQSDILLLMNTATDGLTKIAYQANSFQILYFNKKRAALTGHTSEELSSPSYDVLGEIHPDDIPVALDTFRKSIPVREAFIVLLRLRHKNGHYVPIKLSGIFVDELYQNQYPIFYALYTDLTNQNRSSDI